LTEVRNEQTAGPYSPRLKIWSYSIA